MRVPEPEEERPLAWSAILADTPVYDVEGQDIGSVAEVLGVEDIFHGLAVRSGPMGSTVMVPAVHVVQITNRRILTDLTAGQLRDLPPYHPEMVEQLGITGLLRRVGWVPEGEHDKRGENTT